MEAVAEMLNYLTRQIEYAAETRERRIAIAREYWNGKPCSMLNDKLSRIEMENHQAQFILETAPVRAEREVILDTLANAEMATASIR